jgi:peptidyl-prolyl cis-trans isomerase D
MSETTEESAKVKRRRRQGHYFGWILIAMLVAGLGGFGISSFGGQVASIGSVGSQKITANDYARALRTELNGLSQQFGTQLTLSQATPFGVAERAMQGLVSNTALDGEMARVGLSVGDAVVADQIAAIGSFQGLSGTFDPSTYRDTLRRNNMTEVEFEAGLRRDTARQLMTTAVSGGFEAPAPLTAEIYAWVAEKRGFSWLSLTELSLPTAISTPTEADLSAYYAANIDSYTRGEAKRITYVALLPDKLAPSMPVDDADLRAIYDARIAEFVIPEKRLAERLIYPDQATAEAALADLATGKNFDDLVAARNLTLEDVDLGDVSRTDLGTAAEAVFALTEPGSVSGIVATDLGPAIYRVNAIIEAQETTFDEVKAGLALGLQGTAARRVIADRTEALEDLLAGGATLQDVAQQEGLTLATTDYVAGATDNDAIAGYSAFRQSADALAQGDFPEWIGLDDGGIIAMQLDETIAPAPIPMTEVIQTVTEDWHTAELEKLLMALAEAHKLAITGGASIGTLGIVSVAVAAGRETSLTDAPSGAITQVFAMKPGEVRVLGDGTNVGVIQLDSVTPAQTTGDDVAAIQVAIAASVAQSVSRDALALFTQSLVSAGGLQLDQTVVSAVQASFN